MTVTTSTNKTQPLGNGVTTSFPYSFRIYSESDLVVTRTVIATGIDTVLALNTDYTVTGAGSHNGGNVVCTVAPAAGTRITIRRVLAVTQGTDLRNQGAYFAETHENVFDRLTMVDQQHSEIIGRTLTLPDTTDLTSFEIPSAAASVTRANTVVGFDENGSPTLIPLVVAGSLPLGSQVVEAAMTATAGQTVIATTYEYTPGTLVLVIDGVTLFKDVDFTETTAQSVTLDLPLTGGEAIVRIYGFYSSTVAVSGNAVTYTQPGTGAVQKLLPDKLFFEVWPEEYGAVGDGVTDDTTAIQRMVNAIQSSSTTLIAKPRAKPYLISGTVKVSGPVTIIGQGVHDLENARGITRPDGGTWFIHGSTTGPCFEFNSNMGKGAGIEHCGFYQLGHATPGIGWTPTVRDWVIRNENTQGTLRLNRVHFHNCYKGVLTDHAARPQYENITGQFFYRAFEFDRIYDIGRLDGLHAWTYWSEDNNVLQWTQANGAGVALKRVDGLWMDRIFTFALNIGVWSLDSAYGGAARVITINGLYCDFTARALVVDATGPAHLFISSLFHLGQAWPSSPTAAIAGSCGIDITAGSNHLIQVTNYYSNVCAGASVKIAGTSNQVWIDSELIEQYDFLASGVGAHLVAATNIVHVGSESHITKVGGAQGDVITGAAAGTVRSTVTQQYTGPDTTNRIVTSTNAAGQLAVVTAEGEATAGVAVVAKTTGTVSIGGAANALGFYGSAATVKQTGVPVTAAAIHAALVSLGLISA